MGVPPMARRVIVAVGVLFLVFIIFRPDATARIYGQNPRPYPPPKFSGEDVSALPLRQKLRYYFAFDIEPRFPKYVWQTWKVGREDESFDKETKRLVDSWDKLNTDFTHEVIPDEAALHLINKMYLSLPEVVQAYKDMPLPILKADFFRYLILLARGGVYTDIDTEALQSIEKWIPKSLNDSAAGIVIGLEADPDRDDWAEWYARRIQFCQWTIMSKPGHPILQEVVTRITDMTIQMKEEGRLNKEESDKTVLDHTGPGVWTDAIFAYLNDPEYFNISSKNVSNSDFFNLREPKIIGDVVVLPITSFSPGIGHMGAESTQHPLAFVRHAFSGSWRPDNKQRGGP